MIWRHAVDWFLVYSWVCATFTLIQSMYITPERNPVPISRHSSVSDSSGSWQPLIDFYVWLSFSTMLQSSSMLRMYQYIILFFFFLLTTLPWYGYTTFGKMLSIHLWWTFCFCQFGVIMINAMNTHVQGIVWTYASVWINTWGWNC